MYQSLPRGLYAITPNDVADSDTLIDLAREALEGGARTLQYRASSVDALERDVAVQLRGLCTELSACFIINDDPMLALDCGADGVHLGRRDMSVSHARQLLGNHSIIGVSCYDELDRVLRAERADASYVALGSFFHSRTKPDAVRADLALLGEAVARSSLPVVTIGGITPENGAPLVEAGAHAIAAISGLFSSPDVKAAAGDYRALFD
ncbi:MAG: thiamine phosphate synthase [Pseudomonadota bacterium]